MAESNAPNYRESPYTDKNCANCVHGGQGYCSLYSFSYKKNWICTAWEANEPRMEKHVPPAEVSYNAARGIQLHKDAMDDSERSTDPDKVALMHALAIGRPMHVDEIKTMHDHFEAFHHPAPGDKAARQIHLGLGGQAGRSWTKRVKSLYDGVEKANPNHDEKGRFSAGDAVQRNPKIWKDTPEMKHHNFGTVIAAEPGIKNDGKKTQGYRVRSHADDQVLKDPNADKWDKKSAEKGTWYTDKELVAPSTKKSIDLVGKISKLDDEKHFVFGFASVVQENGRIVVDRQEDTMTQEELEKMAYTYVLECRHGAEMHDPETIGVGELIESMVFTPEKSRAIGIPHTKTAWWIGLHITDPAVWSKIKNGTYKFFSIHGTGERDSIPDHEAKSMAMVEQD